MIKFWQLLKVAWAALSCRSNQAFYDRISPIYDEVFVDHRIHAKTIDGLLSGLYAGKEKATVVLDLGCGTGMISKLLSDRGFRVIGIDVSFESLRILARQGAQLPVIQARAERLPISNGCLQSVVCLGVWRHFTNPQKVLDEVARVLDRDGILIVGYFPPAIAGLIHMSAGRYGQLLAGLYHTLSSKLGYSDRADFALEQEAMEDASKRFVMVSTITSGKYWRLISARYPRTAETVV
ncbi:MAG: class I SAM-dependent methyltransferase [Candidatus Sedimenticola sp. (ex Thyasira tokunagai)]